MISILYTLCYPIDSFIFKVMLFKDVVGHSETKKHLIEGVKKNRISHAQMFLGSEGGGNAC